MGYYPTDDDHDTHEDYLDRQEQARRSDDIAAWLREQDECGFHEAADEIDRLRKRDAERKGEIDEALCHKIRALEAQVKCMSDKLTRVVEVCGVFPPVGALSKIKKIALDHGLESK